MFKGKLSLDCFCCSFSNREIAAIIWILVFTIFTLALLIKQKRTSTINSLFKSMMGISVPVILMTVYVALSVFLLWIICYWDTLLLKDTIIWFIGSAFVLLISSNDSEKEGYFQKIVIDAVKLTILVEFITSAYCFNLLIELILAPIIFFLIILSAISSADNEYKRIEAIANALLAIVGISILVSSTYEIINDYSNFATTDNIRLLLLPPVMTLMYLPFLYCIALYMSYENLFVRLSRYFREDNALWKRTRLMIIKECKFSRERIRRLQKERFDELIRIRNRNDIDNFNITSDTD